MPPAAILAGGMIVSAGASYLGSKKAAKGAERAAATQAQAEMSGAQVAAQSQRESLEYLKQREALPQHMREQALTRLGGVYGIPYSPTPQQTVAPQQAPGAVPTQVEGAAAPTGVNLQPENYPQQWNQQYNAQLKGLTPEVWALAEQRGIANPALLEGPELEQLKSDYDLSQQLQRVGYEPQAPGTIAPTVAQTPEAGTQFGQQDLIQQAMASPLYGAMMGGREAGEEAIMRRAGATGGLRSGNVQEAMYDYNTQLQNQALLQSYNQQLQGLQGLAGLPSYAPQIAGQMAGVGQTLGQGMIGAGTSRAQGQVASGQALQQGLQGVSNIVGSAAGQWADYKTPRI